ncbi:MAG: SOS response-associated peptidase family protein [Clostridia bacterium]|nr:SOS response-associated peptidase family protein [Clostridia bacterium]
MCGRYGFFPEQDAVLQECLRQLKPEERLAASTGVVRPGDTPAVFVMENGAPAVRLARWGMQAPDRPQMVINARSETAADKPMFAGALQQGRCLLPASLYYEWTRRSRSRTRMKVRGGRVTYMAALIRPSATSPTGTEFAVLTREATGEVRGLHDRMPLILPDRLTRRRWLEDETFARLLLKNPPDPPCSVEADEPEQLDLFAQLDDGEA